MSRLNWLWFGPLAAVALFVTESHTIPYALRVAKLAYARWDWGGFTSPSAAFCWSVVIGSVFLPVAGVVMATTTMFDRTLALADRRRSLVSFLIIVAVVALPFVTDALIWGSFPFTFDSAGVGRLRMIPFLPWPDGPFGSY